MERGAKIEKSKLEADKPKNIKDSSSHYASLAKFLQQMRLNPSEAMLKVQSCCSQVSTMETEESDIRFVQVGQAGNWYGSWRLADTSSDKIQEQTTKITKLEQPNEI